MTCGSVPPAGFYASDRLFLYPHLKRQLNHKLLQIYRLILCAADHLLTGKFLPECLHIQHHALHTFQARMLHSLFTNVMCQTGIRVPAAAVASILCIIKLL